MKIKSLAFCSIVALAEAHARGQGTVIYDQQSSTGTVLEGSYFNLSGSSQPVGQSFTPSLNAVGIISLNMYSGPVTGGVYVDVLLHSGSITGPTLGTSEAAFIPANTFSGFVDFIFNTPVPVTAGTQYYFQPVIQTGPDAVSVGTADGYNYAGGNAFFQGTPYPATDLWFREGIIVPEPATWALLLLGAGALVWLRRR